MKQTEGPHQGQDVVEGGVSLQEAVAAVVLVHGRGASAHGMLAFADALQTERVAFRAPQAAGFTWYPNSFLAPLDANEPGISSGVQAISDVVEGLEYEGLPAKQIVVLGFSQGACLSLEFAARAPRRLGGVIAWSGGLIGSGQIAGQHPPDDKAFDYAGSLDGTPVFLGCSDIDAHIPIQRVKRSAEIIQHLGADVTSRVYPGMGHTVNRDELQFARELVQDLENRAGR